MILYIFLNENLTLFLYKKYICEIMKKIWILVGNGQIGRDFKIIIVSLPTHCHMKMQVQGFQPV